jgi:UDP-N-acetylmuramyl tripeptide synthase
MSHFATPAIGKLVRMLARIAHHGGSALPGRVVERIDPGFLARTLDEMSLGVVLVSGTNGKTTTTRMVSSMLSRLGFKVFTNPTGSNFTRGVVSALLAEVSLTGKIDADIAVLELDEAYAVHFVRQVKPTYALLLNVMRDQLDRFGEIDATARMLGHVAEATCGTVMLNREDPRIAALADVVPEGTDVRYFGLADDLRHFFPSDDDMATTVSVESDGLPGAAGLAGDAGARTKPAPADPVASADPETAHAMPADVTLTAVGDHQATFHMGGRDYETGVRLEGVYNLYNAAAALAVVRMVAYDDVVKFAAQNGHQVAARPRPQDEERAAQEANRDEERAGTRDEAQSAANSTEVGGIKNFIEVSDQACIAAVARVTPAFGRGEIINVNDSPVELLLVKNPMGFRLSLASFDPDDADTMIAINDEYADGRDMSWLWDVDFTSLRATGVSMVSGVRAWDMALRLGYDQVPVDVTDTDLEAAVSEFVAANPGKRKHIYCTYTAMLKIRAALGHITQVRDAGVGR